MCIAHETFLEAGYDIRTIQQLLGDKHVETRMIYTHVLIRGGRASEVRRMPLSPFGKADLYGTDKTASGFEEATSAISKQITGMDPLVYAVGLKTLHDLSRSRYTKLN